MNKSSKEPSAALHIAASPEAAEEAKKWKGVITRESMESYANRTAAEAAAQGSPPRTCICSSSPHTEECDLANFRLGADAAAGTDATSITSKQFAEYLVSQTPAFDEAVLKARKNATEPDSTTATSKFACPKCKLNCDDEEGLAFHICISSPTAATPTTPPSETPSGEGLEGVQFEERKPGAPRDPLKAATDYIAKHYKKAEIENGVLREAEGLIYGERRAEYGSVEDSFKNVAKMWSVLLQHEVSAKQVALCMAALKMCREIHAAKRDSIVDACGYLALAQQIEEAKR